MRVEIDSTIQSKRKESLGHRALIFVPEAMVQLRVDVLIIVVLHADRSPTEVLQVVLQFDEENAIVFIKIPALSLQLGGPQG